MADPAAVGTRGTPFRMDIERGKVREFAVATGATPADDPAYLDAEHPVIEPTFLTTAFFWQTGAADPWPAVALDQQRGLHAEQEFVFFGPPPAGRRPADRHRRDHRHLHQTGATGWRAHLRGDDHRLHRRDRAGWWLGRS